MGEKFNQKLEVINAGISGSTSASAASRLKWFMKKDPDVIVLALGANDILRGIKPSTTEQHLEKAIKFILSKKKKMILCGVRVPPNYGVKHAEEFEKFLITYQKNTRSILFLNYLKMWEEKFQ